MVSGVENISGVGVKSSSSLGGSSGYCLSVRSNQVFATQQEDVPVSGAGIKPDKRDIRECQLQIVAIVSDLDHQYSFRFEMTGRFPENDAYQIEPVLAAGQRELRFPSVFCRQYGYRLGIDVGRIGDDHVVLVPLNSGKDVGFKKPEARSQLIVIDIPSGYCERFGR